MHLHFPSWHNLNKKISEFEQKVAETIGDLKAGHPVIAATINGLFAILPYPANEIFSNIFYSFDPTYPDRTDEVLKRLDEVMQYNSKLKDMKEDDYNMITSQLQEITRNLDAAKIIKDKNTLVKIRDILISTGEVTNQKLDDLKNDISRLEVKVNKIDKTTVETNKGVQVAITQLENQNAKLNEIKTALDKFTERKETAKNDPMEKLSLALETLKDLTHKHMDLIDEAVSPVMDRNDLVSTCERYKNLVNNQDIPRGYQEISGIFSSAFHKLDEFAKGTSQNEKLSAVVKSFGGFQLAAFILKYDSFEMEDHFELATKLWSHFSGKEQIDSEVELQKLQQRVHDNFRRVIINMANDQGRMPPLDDPPKLGTADDVIRLVSSWCKEWQRYVKRSLYVGHGGLDYAIGQLELEPKPVDKIPLISSQNNEMDNPPKPSFVLDIELIGADGVLVESNLDDLRKATMVEKIPFEESGKEIQELPNGIFGYRVPWDIDGKEKMQLGSSRGGTAVLEIHKSKQGEVFIVGFIDKYRLSELKFSFFPEGPFDKSKDAAAIPLELIKNTRLRDLD